MDKSALIRNEIAAWRAEGLIDPATADRLAARYAPGSARSWGMLLAGIFGAFLVGLGLLVLVAANWDAFGRTARTLFALLPVTACGGAALAFAARGRTGPGIMEPLGLLWLAAVAAGTAIVARTYPLSESPSVLHLAIAILAWPVLWAVRARLAVAVWTVFAIVAACMRADNLHPNTAFIAAAATAVAAFSALPWTFAVRARGEGPLTASARWLMGLAYAAGLPALCCFVSPRHLGEDWYAAPFFVFAALVALLGRATRHAAWARAATLVAILVAIPQAAPWERTLSSAAIAFWAGSLLYAAALAVHGVRGRSIWHLNAGALLAAWLVVGRFLAGNAAYTLKGLLLVAAGAALWLLNVWMARTRKREAAP